MNFPQLLFHQWQNSSITKNVANSCLLLITQNKPSVTIGVMRAVNFCHVQAHVYKTTPIVKQSYYVKQRSHTRSAALFN